jgi:hypothetical protein
MRYSKISKHDVLEININLNGASKKSKYLTVSVEKDHVKLLPLKEYYKNNYSEFIVPCIDMPMSMINEYIVLDRSVLLYLVNSNNPHILLALNALKDRV